MSPEIPESPTCAAVRPSTARNRARRLCALTKPTRQTWDQDRTTSILIFWAPPLPARPSHGETRRRGVSNTSSLSRHGSHTMLATAGGCRTSLGALNAEWLMTSVFLPSETGSGSMQRLEPEQAELRTYFWCWLMARTGYVAQMVTGSPGKNAMTGSIHSQTGLYCTCCSPKPLLCILVCLAHTYPTPSIHQTLTLSIYFLGARRALHDRNSTQECSSSDRSVDTSAPQALTKNLC